MPAEKAKLTDVEMHELAENEVSLVMRSLENGGYVSALREYLQNGTPVQRVAAQRIVEHLYRSCAPVQGRIVDTIYLAPGWVVIFCEEAETLEIRVPAFGKVLMDVSEKTVTQIGNENSAIGGYQFRTDIGRLQLT